MEYMCSYWRSKKMHSAKSLFRETEKAKVEAQLVIQAEKEKCHHKEKELEFIKKSNQYAKESNSIARKGNYVSLFAVAISIITLVVAVLK